MKPFMISSLIAAWLIAASHAVLVKDGLTDGIYTLEDISSPSLLNDSPSPAKALRRREGLLEKPGWPPWEEYSVPLPITNRKCNDDYGDLNVSDYRRAVANLKTFCDDFYVSPRGLYVSVAGQAMVYVCSFRRRSVCHRHEWDEAERALDDSCGRKGAGWIKMKKWRKKYGRGHVGMRICDKVNDGPGKHYAIDPMPVWVNGSMFELWKTGNLGKAEFGE